MRRHLRAATLFGAALLLLPESHGLAQAGRGFTTNFTLAEFAGRRARICTEIGPTSIALIQGAPTVHSSAVFRQSNEFFYLTGVVAPQALLLMDGATKRSILYLPKQNTGRAATEGELLSSDDPAATAKITGIDEVKSPDQLLIDLQAQKSATAIFVPFQPFEGDAESRDGAQRVDTDAGNDPWDGRITRQAQFRDLLKARVPALDQKNLSPIMDAMRAIKSPAEIALMDRATKIGDEAILESMRSTMPGVSENEIDALARFIFVRHGAQGEAYRAIVASGSGALNPHHRASEKVMTDGEMVVMDYCPDLGYYRCDVTRSWPVNGKFSPAQREYYGFYLSAYEALLYAIKPNITAQAILQEAVPKMEKILAATTFSKPIYQAAAKTFVERYKSTAARGGNLGHGIGMSTHDMGGGSGVMRPGLTFTIEPEFRVPEEQIYIRFEDMIVITDTGVRILSDSLPRSIAAVEKAIAEPGLLQQYKRIK